MASPLFSVDSRLRKIVPNAPQKVDIVYYPYPDLPETLTVYGFAAAIQESNNSLRAVRLSAKYFTDFMVRPEPSGGIIILDFGRLEIGTDSPEMITKNLTLYNAYESKYSWSFKLMGNQKKFNAFEIGMLLGDLPSLESTNLPIRISCESPGIFESHGELEIKDIHDRGSKPLKVVNVVMKGHVISHTVTGFPDSLDFGSIIVLQEKSEQFTIMNNGTADINISMLIKPPFYVESRDFILEPRSAREVPVRYLPKESGVHRESLNVYMNSKLQKLICSGSAGTAELSCVKYLGKPVDFGSHREGTISTVSIFLRNTGTLPVLLKAITADNPDLLKVS